PTPTPEPTPETAPAAEGGAAAETPAAEQVTCQITAERGLRMRSGPGTTFKVIGLLKNQANVTATGRSEAGDWLAVTNAAGTSGWVSADWVDCSADVMTLPVSGG
ncbi:MAG: SH3 domain-containing protein, partial [Caldilineae bacterium]